MSFIKEEDLEVYNAIMEDEQKESSNTKSKVPDKKEVTSYKNMYF